MQDLRLQRVCFAVTDRLTGIRYRILPAEDFVRDLAADVARTRAEVTMRQFEPGPGERLVEFLRIRPETLGDLAKARVFFQ